MELLSIARGGGVGGVFRGLGPTLCRDVPFSGFYWTVYEEMKPLLSKTHTFENNHVGISFLSGSVAGTVAAFLTTPFDVVKTHQQAAVSKERGGGKGGGGWGEGTYSLLKRIWKADGFGGLFAGVLPRCARVAPSCAIMISAYEFTKTHLG